jgi:hypothetical protein
MNKETLLLLSVQVTIVVYFFGRLFLKEIYGSDRAATPFSSSWVAPWNRAFYMAETERLFELYKDQLTEEELEILIADIYECTEPNSDSDKTEEITSAQIKDFITYRF